MRFLIVFLNCRLVETVKGIVKTIFFFSLATISAPFLFLTFIGVHYSNELWEYLLTVKYPNLEISKSKKIRTLIDTPRNAGIFNFLLQMEGPLDFNKIKETYLANLTEKRDKSGEFKYAKIKQRLLTCWGHYAWVKDTSAFNIDHHILMTTGKYRGRPVTENTLQEYVSELVTKYIPANIPQWQVLVIPISGTNERYYILIKLHHLLLAEEQKLHVSDILMLSGTNSDKLTVETLTTPHPPKLYDFVEKPKHIPRLWNHLAIVISNAWNEFLFKYDSLDGCDLEKKPRITCFSQLMSSLFITVVTIVLDYLKGRTKVRKELKYQWKFMNNIVQKEITKRNLSMEVAIDAIFWSMNPINVAKNAIKFIVILNLSKLLYLPIHTYKEIFAMKDLIFKGHTNHTSTFMGWISIYLPMCCYASLEFLSISKKIVETPKNIFEELFQFRAKEGNVLQVKSFSGRKVVSFSKAVKMQDVRARLKIKNNRKHDSELVLTCIGSSLKKFFEGFEDHYVPQHLNATSMTLSKDYLLERYDKTVHIGGVVFFQLPLNEPCGDQFVEINRTISRIRSRQIGIYLASIGQTKFDLVTSIFPRVLMKILINYFSFNFPVTITEIYGNASQFESAWGQKVEDVLLFRPPQNKTCLSISVHRFGDLVRLGIMADTQLAPHHSKIPQYWENYMQNFLF